LIEGTKGFVSNHFIEVLQMLVSHINELIKKKGLRPGFVAEQLGVTRGSVTNWSKGRSYPNMEKGFELSRLLGVTVEDLYTYKEDTKREQKHDITNETIEILDLSPRLFFKLKKENIHTVEDLLDADITKISGIGPKTLKEINEKLDERSRHKK
jgi:putative transcriptional regulator